MTAAQANVVRAFALWTVYVWITRIVNILGDDHDAGFKAVHTALAVISIALAVAAWVAVRRARRRTVAATAHGDKGDEEDAVETPVS